jgi:hypothetical protein
MKSLLAVAVSILLASCASFDGRGLTAGQSSAADVERVMGAPAERRQVGAETWLYFPRQPFGRKTFVARLGADGRLLALEQRLTDETVAQIVPNTTRAERVRDLLGPPYQATQFARMDRNVWTWHMRRFGDPGIPVQLNVQMSPDGVVREVYVIDESDSNIRSDGVTLGLGLGR